jgi:hypothetical protein
MNTGFDLIALAQTKSSPQKANTDQARPLKIDRPKKESFNFG